MPLLVFQISIFWREGGYLAIAEEQFYLLWPLSMLLERRYFRRYVWLLLATAFLVSLAAADYESYAGNEHTVFFLLPSRVFEFSVGATFVWLVDHQAKSGR